jgi:hypothetical protein
MHAVDLPHGVPGLADIASTPADADAGSAASAQPATTAQNIADSSAEAERLLTDLCGIKVPLLYPASEHRSTRFHSLQGDVTRLMMLATMPTEQEATCRTL